MRIKRFQIKMREMYEKNKKVFIEYLKTIQIAKITPQISGGNEFNEAFFNKLDEIENKILDGQSFQEAVKENNLKSRLIEKVNKNKIEKEEIKINDLSDPLFVKIFNLKKINEAKIIQEKNDYYIVEIKSSEEKTKTFDDPDVQKTLKKIIKFKNKIENNSQFIQDISLGGFDEVKLENFSKKNNLEFKNYKISNLKQNEIFSENLIKRIFLLNDGDVDLITNKNFTKNFLILVKKTDFKKIKKDTNTFERYQAKAKLELMNRIYRTFDNNLNIKYKVKLNQKTINKIKNSF